MSENTIARVSCKQCRFKFAFDQQAVELMVYPQIICPVCGFDNVDPSTREPMSEEEKKIQLLQFEVEQAKRIINAMLPCDMDGQMQEELVEWIQRNK